MTDREIMQQALEALELLSQAPVETALDYADNAITTLRERLAQPEQEPNYWLGYGLQAHTEKPFEGATPLYTSPPQRKPLTDEEIDTLVIGKDGLPNSHLEFARAIEAAHGIKGEA